MRSVLLVAGLFCLVAGSAFGQGVATNRDGSVLYFGSSAVMSGSNQHAWGKIFRWTEARGVELFAEREPLWWGTAFPLLWDGRPNYRLVWPTVSDDGSTVGFTGVLDCTSGSICGLSVELYESTILAGGGAPGRRLSGSAGLSGNGAHAYSVSSIRKPVYRNSWWLDVRSGQESSLSDYEFVMGGNHPVTDDGRILRRSAASGESIMSLSRPSGDASGDLTLVGFSGTGVSVLSRDGRLVVSSGARGLVVYDVARQVESVLPGTTGKDSALDISADGSVVLTRFGDRDPSSLRVMRTDGTGSAREVLAEFSGSAVMSGDGRVVYVALTNGSVVRVDVESGRRVTIVPEGLLFSGHSLFPVDGSVAAGDRTVARGSLLRLRWLAGAPETNGGEPVAARLRGKEWPIVSVNISALVVRVPEDAPLEAVGTDLQLVFGTVGGFDVVIPSAPWKVAEVAPIWFFEGSRQLAVHGDWRGMVTDADPARAGEVPHLYGTGFGVLDASGRARVGLTCSVDGSPAEVLYAGVAPGMIDGVNQVDVRLPAESDGTLRCSAGGRPMLGQVVVKATFIGVSAPG